MILREYVNMVLNEEGSKYYEIVFLQGDEAEEPLKILRDDGEKAALKYLTDWDYGKEMEHSPVEQPWGDDDDIYEDEDYVMSYNQKLGYIGLVRRVVKDEDETKSPKEPEAAEAPEIPPEGEEK